MILRLGRRLALPLVGGALAGLSLPPLGWWPLAPVGLALVAAALRSQRPGARLLTGLTAGIGQFFVALAWALQFSVAGYVALALVEACFLAVAALLVPPGRGRIPCLAGAVTLAEWARWHWPFGGLPLGGIALGQVGGPLGDTARVGGALLVVGLAALGGAGLAALAVAAATRRPRAALPGALALAVVAALAGAGYAAPDGGSPRPRSIDAALVQGGGRRGLDQLQVPPSVVLQAAFRATRLVPRHVDLIVWPEDVVAMNGPFTGSGVAAELSGVARRHHATLLAGVTVPVGTSRFRNEIVAISPAGRVVDVFEKVHRVPFGEYVPWRGFFKHLANLRDVPRDAIAGTGSGLMTTPAGRFAVLVSYEVFFADRGRSGVRAGGEVILVPTNTSSYSNDQAPAQEIAASRLQALEEGRYVLQVAPTGYSAVIDNRGNVLRRSDLSRQAVVTATVPELTGTTWYADWGDGPTLVAGLVAVAAGWLAALGATGLTPRGRRRLRRRTSPSR